ncbi:hypothetical protein AK812_SmicGene45674 [Symbiodinium microadriaticum]|uniref:Uncharacterized protein n=1 Tax=Symbiodinium microadriaticum TaxID=2951 RepID=A0A1Q9BVK3_SYMMI|nr:hypothetical protein AK812_SmicGene45674 [Symbiodinium microadriaticum]
MNNVEAMDRVPFFDSMDEASVFNSWMNNVEVLFFDSMDEVWQHWRCGASQKIPGPLVKQQFLSTISWMSNLEAMGRVPVFDSVDDVWQSWRCGASQKALLDAELVELVPSKMPEAGLRREPVELRRRDRDTVRTKR